MKDTREGEGVTREFATGSTTSSRVMEFMSNQASEVLPATILFKEILAYTAEAAVVTSHTILVQSNVPVSLDDVVIVPREPAELYSMN